MSRVATLVVWVYVVVVAVFFVFFVFDGGELVRNPRQDPATAVVESRVVQGWNTSQRNLCHPGKRAGRGMQTRSD